MNNENEEVVYQLVLGFQIHWWAASPFSSSDIIMGLGNTVDYNIRFELLYWYMRVFYTI